MMRHCREIGLWIFLMDKSQWRRSSEYYASSITKTIFCLHLGMPGTCTSFLLITLPSF